MRLPPQLTSFVGRRAELAQVAALLRAHRLVTVAGTAVQPQTHLDVEALLYGIPFHLFSNRGKSSAGSSQGWSASSSIVNFTFRYATPYSCPMTWSESRSSLPPSTTC